MGSLISWFSAGVKEMAAVSMITPTRIASWRYSRATWRKHCMTGPRKSQMERWYRSQKEHSSWINAPTSMTPLVFTEWRTQVTLRLPWAFTCTVLHLTIAKLLTNEQDTKILLKWLSGANMVNGLHWPQYNPRKTTNFAQKSLLEVFLKYCGALKTMKEILQPLKFLTKLYI